MKLWRKVTEGCVEQLFDPATGSFISQRFIAGTECEYLDENGKPTEGIWPDYLPFDMVQPKQTPTITVEIADGCCTDVTMKDVTGKDLPFELKIVDQDSQEETPVE